MPAAILSSWPPGNPAPACLPQVLAFPAAVLRCLPKAAAQLLQVSPWRRRSASGVSQLGRPRPFPPPPPLALETRCPHPSVDRYCSKKRVTGHGRGLSPETLCWSQKQPRRNWSGGWAGLLRVPGAGEWLGWGQQLERHRSKETSPGAGVCE